jgi:hypothetical protein
MRVSFLVSCPQSNKLEDQLSTTLIYILQQMKRHQVDVVLLHDETQLPAIRDSLEQFCDQIPTPMLLNFTNSDCLSRLGELDSDAIFHFVAGMTFDEEFLGASINLALGGEWITIHPQYLFLFEAGNFEALSYYSGVHPNSSSQVIDFGQEHEPQDTTADSAITVAFVSSLPVFQEILRILPIWPSFAAQAKLIQSIGREIGVSRYFLTEHIGFIPFGKEPLSKYRALEALCPVI